MDLETVVKHISKEKVYFSFATKLLATKDTNRPIYDERVRAALKIPSIIW
jgi:hypothetical protein